MFTTLAITALAATTARASFQEWVWGSGDAQATLTGSISGNTVVAALEGYAEDANARKWEIANGQLRSGSGQCAYPAIGPNWDVEATPPGNNRPYEVSIQQRPCQNGQHNKWSVDGNRIKWDGAYCLDNTDGFADATNPVQLWLCSTYENPNQIWRSQEPSS